MMFVMLEYTVWPTSQPTSHVVRLYQAWSTLADVSRQRVEQAVTGTQGVLLLGGPTCCCSQSFVC